MGLRWQAGSPIVATFSHYVLNKGSSSRAFPRYATSTSRPTIGLGDQTPGIIDQLANSIREMQQFA